MRNWLYYRYTDRMWVEFGYTIDDCKTVEMTEIEMVHAFLALSRNFACGADVARLVAARQSGRCKMRKFYSLLIDEETGHDDVIVFSDEYEFACAVLSAAELGNSGSSLIRTNRSDLTKNQIDDSIYFDSDEAFRQHFGLVVI